METLRAHKLSIAVLVFFFAYLAVNFLLDYRSAVLWRAAPFRSPNAQAALRHYAALRSSKAFAASVTLNRWGWSSGYGDHEEAKHVALTFCEQLGDTCVLYAVGDSVVWDPSQADKVFARIVSTRAPSGAVWRYHGEARPHGVPLVMPPEAPSIISDYFSAHGVLGGLRSEYADVRPRHGGIDIIGEIGTPVLAAAAGVVVAADFDPIAGNLVQIGHSGSNGDAALVTEYIHLEKILVEAGEMVHRGQQIGTLGITGTGTTPERPHLHVETGGTNPHLHWYDGPGRVTCFSEERVSDQDQTALTYPVRCGPTVKAGR